MAWPAFGAGSGITLLGSALVGVSLHARTRQERMTINVTEARDALAAATKERLRLGHDLHDGAIQSLHAVQLGLTRTAESVESSLPGSARVLEETRANVDEVIAELRGFILAREAGAEAAEPIGLDRVLAAMIDSPLRGRYPSRRSGGSVAGAGAGTTGCVSESTASSSAGPNFQGNFC